jgi:hypothetical protein
VQVRHISSDLSVCRRGVIERKHLIEWIWCDELKECLGPTFFGGPLGHLGTPDKYGYSRSCEGKHYEIRPSEDDLIDETVYF